MDREAIHSDALRNRQRLHGKPPGKKISPNGLAASLLIRADFGPTRSLRNIQQGNRALAVLLAIALLASLVIYGISVYFESQINTVGKKAQALFEDNKNLQVILNRSRSFKRVEHAAMQSPQLHQAEEIIEVDSRKTPTPLEFSHHNADRSPPPLYGY